MSWDDVYGYDGGDFPDYEPDYSFGDEGLDYEPDYSFGDEGLDYEPDYSFGNDFLGNEPADYSFGNVFPDCEPDHVATIKSPSSSVASGKTPIEKRKVMKKPPNNPNDKRSKSSQKASTKLSSSKSTSKKFEKKPGSEPKKSVKFDVPTKKRPKKPQLSNKDPRKNQQSSSKHRKTPKRDLAGAIRKFSASKVKIPKEDTKWARKMADTHIEFVRGLCQEKWKGIFNHFEFTGSFYEHLKTEAANELDILVALDTKDNADLVVEDVPGVPGYALIKVTKESSKYWARFADNNGYVRPKKVRSKFFGVVQQVVNEYKKKKGDKDPVLKPSDNGPATKLVIDDKEAKKKLEVDLVPAFLFKTKKDSPLSVPEGRHYVAKQLPEQMIIPDMKCTREMLWRQSFSLEEKKKMENLDKKDSGCRREVVKVMKTIVKNDSTLAKLSSYHIKTAFLHYNFDEGQENLDWSVKYIAERLKGLMEYLRQSISDKNLSHFFIKELNLLKELKDSSLENIEGRLKKLITSESELRRVLAVQPEESNEGQGQGKVEAKKAKKKPKKSKRQGQAKSKPPHKPVSLLNSKSRVKSKKLKTQRLEAEVMQIIAAILGGHQS